VLLRVVPIIRLHFGKNVVGAGSDGGSATIRDEGPRVVMERGGE
jgi:hypothetical protein